MAGTQGERRMRMLLDHAALGAGCDKGAGDHVIRSP